MVDVWNEAGFNSSSIRPRPWLRFWARTVDYNVYTIFAVALMALSPILLQNALLGGLIGSFLLGFITLGGWVFLEALLLSVWGNTPGKWLCKITIRTMQGNRLTYGQALKRSVWVLFGGMGLEIPVLNLIIPILTYWKLVKTGKTAWDEKGGFVVSSQVLGFARIILLVILLFLLCGGYFNLTSLLYHSTPKSHSKLEDWPAPPESIESPIDEPGQIPYHRI